MKQESLTSLQEDLDLLISKHHTFIQNNEFGQALNVMKNVDILSSQLKDLDYRTMVSKYTMLNDNAKVINEKVITIWEQNLLGDIKDVETYFLGAKYESSFNNVFNTITKNWDTMSTDIKDSICKFVGGKKDKNIVSSIVEESIKLDKANPWYDFLKYFITNKQNQLLKLDYSSMEAQNQHRGTGKTSAIVRLSNDFNIPIYTNNSHISTLRDRAKELKLNPIILSEIRQLNLPQYEKCNMVLVDEMTDSNLIPDYKIIVGFKH